MSQQLRAYSTQAATRHGHGRPAAARSVKHTHHSRAPYTLSHGKHQVRIGPIAFWIAVGTLVIMGVWSLATGTYFAFHDNVLARLIGRQAEMQFAYEDRIADLRAQIDRITSRQLLDQEQFEEKLNTLLNRQAVLERHTSALSGDIVTTGSIGRGHAASELPASGKLKLSPLSKNTDSPSNIVSRVSLALDRIERHQNALLTYMEEDTDNKTHRIRDVLAELGVKVRKTAHRANVGGPFVPLKPPGPNASSFDRELYHFNVARAEIDQYKQTLATVPVRKPVSGEVDMSSPFGVRIDPFLGRPAMHTGLDLRGDIGEPVRATASGRVSIAGREGGYGNMVEINHGNGLATRYGHLSEIDVRPGQQVRIGEVIGKIGSTGRSTGPHLHYETRLNGEPIDPTKFLHAGDRLGSL